LPAKDRAERRGDLRRGEGASGDLVHERLEERVVLAVNDDHLDRRAAQSAHRLQPGEPAADDDHAMGFHAATASSTGSSPSFSSAGSTKSRSRIKSSEASAAAKEASALMSRIVFSPPTSAERALAATRPRNGAGVDATACGVPPVEMACASVCA